MIEFRGMAFDEGSDDSLLWLLRLAEEEPMHVARTDADPDRIAESLGGLWLGSGGKDFTVNRYATPDGEVVDFLAWKDSMDFVMLSIYRERR